MPATPVLTSLLIAAMMQVGPNPDPDSVTNAIPRSPREASAEPARPQPTVSIVPACPLGEGVEPAEVARIAQQRVQLSSGRDRIGAMQCLAMAEAELGAWDDAAAHFLAARDLAGEMPEWQARIGSQRGHALAEAGRIRDARSAFEAAIADAMLAGDAITAGQIAADQSIIEVSAGDMAAANRTLSAARERSPGEYRVWLLSATLARREGDLSTAQQFIETAATLDALDPEVGLEAGVIAALAGRYDAARASFRSVVAQPHAGAAAKTAQDYLDQLGPDEAAAEGTAGNTGEDGAK
ncbi:MAG: hypothetical protein R3D99_01725 [Altererythrobacter sp.]